MIHRLGQSKRVHGGIRHLENITLFAVARTCVHGGIRHLEKFVSVKKTQDNVHGGIRHLEI